jgi:hypothetical protein
MKYSIQNTGRILKKRKILLIIVIALLYGMWFNFLDSAAYCVPENSAKQVPTKKVPPRSGCIETGKLFDLWLGEKQYGPGNGVYQPWNVLGHCLPGLFMLLLERKKAELLFVSGILISSAVMDSPLWGLIRLDLHNLALWHAKYDGNTLVENFVPTDDLGEWIRYYYNPIGLYPVWNNTNSDNSNANVKKDVTNNAWWSLSNWPNAAMLFWSLVARIFCAFLLLYYEGEPAKRVWMSLKPRVLRHK